MSCTGDISRIRITEETENEPSLAHNGHPQSRLCVFLTDAFPAAGARRLPASQGFARPALGAPGPPPLEPPRPARLFSKAVWNIFSESGLELNIRLRLEFAKMDQARALRYRRLALREPDQENANLLRLIADESDRGVLVTSDWCALTAAL